MIEFRELVAADDLAALPAFEERVWGVASESVPVNVLVATISEGGVAIAAFDGGRVVGAVYGFATREPDVLHSHYLAVDAAYRRQGLARALKQRQRDWCLAHGYTAMRWTYDPLQVANARFNVAVLGAHGVAYHRDHYGALDGINGGLPSDRVTVCWALRDGEEAAATEQRVVSVPEVSADDIANSTPAALAARLYLRAELQPALDTGWRITGFDPDAQHYLLTR